MRTKPLNPWVCSRQKKLLHAVFHVDESRASSLVDKWLWRHTIDDVTYAEHRVLVRLLARFPDRFQDHADFPRLTGLRRQMWTRGNVNLKTVCPVLSKLSDGNIPWVLTGSAQWFVRDGFPFREEADVVEFSIPPSHRLTVEQILIQSGWQREWTASGATAALFSTFSKDAAGRVRICNAEKLFPRRVDRELFARRLWAEREEVHHPSGTVFLPDAVSLFWIAIRRSCGGYIPADQWIFDLFNLTEQNPPAVDFFRMQATDPNTKKTIRFLKTKFGLSSRTV